MLKVAVLDDYSNLAWSSADWSPLDGVAEVTVFDRHLGEAEAVGILQPFDVLCTMRERMAFPARLLRALPNLKLVTIVGKSLSNFDMGAATELGILAVHPDFTNPRMAGNGNPPAEMTWALILAAVRQIGPSHKRILDGEWSVTPGVVLEGRTLGLLGLGNIGQRVASWGHAFGMEVIAWSENLTTEAAAEHGVERVDKDELFRRADVVSIGLVLSERTAGLVGSRELELMRPGSYLVNTSRAGIVDTAALVEALRSGRLAGAGLDVFDEEPLPLDHPLREVDTVTLTPHIGYGTRAVLSSFYTDLPEAIAAYAAGSPVRVINPEALGSPRHGAPAGG